MSVPFNPRTMGCRCDECPLRGKKPVPPEGPLNPELVIVGEAPGALEETKGLPFQGPSGQLLNEMLKENGTKRERVYVTNTLFCRPEVPDLQGPKRYDLPTYVAWLRKTNTAEKRRAKKERRSPQVLNSPLECCRPHLRLELLYFERRATGPNGLVVVPVGAFALQATTGKKKISKWRGSPIPIDIDLL